MYVANGFLVHNCHHTVATSYRKVLEGLQAVYPSLRHVGVTATPMRADGEGLAQVYDREVAHYGIKEMVGGGWLVPPRWLAIQTGISLAQVAISKGDFVGKQLADVFETANCFELVVESHKKYADGRQCLAFVQSVDGAYRLAETFREAGVVAEAADGTTPKDERAGILRRFRSGKTQVLCNVALWTEGLDVPQVSCIHQVRPTKSDGLYCLDLKTEVLTPDGWKRHDEVEAGDLVAAFDSEEESTVWQPALAKVERPLYAREKMYRLSTPSLDIRVSGQHRMLYQNTNKNAFWLISTAEKLSQRKTMYRLPVSGIQKACGLPLSDAEISLVGWYISDGTISASNGQMVISQSEHQKEQLKHLRQTLHECGLKYGVHRAEYSDDNNFEASSASLRFYVSKGEPRGTDKHLSGWAHLEPYLDKNLSPPFDDMTAEQLAVLLEALHMGDGAKQRGQYWTRRSYHIASVNRVFCDRLQSLCVRRG
jgi:hypothetical protein